MIKCPPPDILELLHKFVDSCLDKSLMSWAMDGSINEPNNYTGISISSALLNILLQEVKPNQQKSNRLEEGPPNVNMYTKISSQQYVTMGERNFLLLL